MAKSKEPKWSESLTKNHVDDFVFSVEAPLSAVEQKALADMKFYCGGVFETPERIKKVREKIKALKKAATSTVKIVADAVLEELAEIESDLKFAKSRRGKFILFVNDWAQCLYKEVRTKPCFDNIIAGSHMEKEVIVIAGTVSKHEHLIDLVRAVEKKDAGVLIEYRVLVSG